MSDRTSGDGRRTRIGEGFLGSRRALLAGSLRSGGPGWRLHPVYLLRWVYLGRVALASGILLGAFLVWGEAEPEQTFLSTLLFLGVLAITGWGLWRTQFQERLPSRGFLFVQMAFDVCAVTAIVHITGGPSSVFAALYIPVIAVSAVILPGGGVGLIGGLAAILYLADAVWARGLAISGGILLQIGLFAIVAGIAGLLGGRLRRADTALEEVEAELRRLRLDTSDILGSVTSGVLTIDQDGRLIYMNAAAESLLGLDADEWNDAPVLGAIERVAPSLAGHFRRSLTEGVSLVRRTADAIRDREDLTLGVTITVREAEGEPRAVTGVFQDITDHERLALLNRQNERLEAVAALSASMAHEIKNPMASIRSAVEQFTSSRITDEDRLKLAAMIARESNRLSRLLSDFIDFARVQVSRRERVDLGRIVEEAASVVRRHPDAQERKVDVEVDLPASPVFLTGDEDLLHRAALNLLLNAAQFSPEETNVEVRVEDLRGERATAPEPASGGRTGPGRGAGGDRRFGARHPVRVRVRDHGPGIPKEELGKLFDPFYTTRREGSGLGLALVHRAVEAHHGAVVVEDPPGGGAEFVLFLPADSAGERSAHTDEEGETEPMEAEVGHG